MWVKREQLKKIGGVKNHEEFCGKRILGSLFGKVYLEKPILGKSIQENLFRTPYTGNLFAKTCSGKFIQENLFRKIYLGNLFRTLAHEPYSQKLAQENLLRRTYLEKLTQEPYSRKTGSGNLIHEKTYS